MEVTGNREVMSESRIIKEKTLAELSNLDFFVYSSHKSGTQTLVSSLNASGAKSRHIHTLRNINLPEGSLPLILNNYLSKNNKKLNVITVFRNPFERHISSFFQWYGTRPLDLGQVKDIRETLIFKSSINKLQEIFLSELKAQSLTGFNDSLHEIFKELKICADDLKLFKHKKYGIYETEKIKIYFLRHDVFFNEFEILLNEICGLKIVQKNKNMSSDKYYKEIYAEFKKSLSVPYEIISRVYDSKADLMRLFYESETELIISKCKTEYGDR
jgi:hypothetical protein